MSTALNDRDAILQAASVRIINPKNADILMKAEPSLFHVNAAGAVDVAATTITATLIGLEGDVTFAVDGATLTSVTGKTAVVRYVDMQGPAAIVTARIVAGGEPFTQSCIIGVVRDGAPGNGTPGARGAGQYFAGGSVWSDGTANAATPGDNVVSDVVTISNGGTFAMTKRWDGAAWNAIGAVFDGSLFVTGSINGAALKVGTVEIRKPDGTLILGAGGTLAAEAAAPGTKNSEIVVGGRNLFPDGDFERGVHTLQGTVSAYTTNREGAISGTKSLFMDGTVADMYAWLVTRANVTPGKEYRISFYSKSATVGVIIGSSSYIRTWNSSGAVDYVLLPMSRMGSGAWERQVVAWTCPPGITQIEPRFGITTNGAYSWLAIDCVQIEEGNAATQWTPSVEDIAADAQAKADASRTAAQIYATEQVNLANVATRAYADGKVTAEEQRAIADATAKANAARDAAIADANASKLNKGGDVLRGIISVDTVNAPAGFRAGTLTWNAAGDYTGGYGTAMTPKGLVGYDIYGRRTFLINGQNGNVQLYGDLMGGSYSEADWPAPGYGGFFLGHAGLFLGNARDGKFVRVGGDGNMYMPGFAHENGQLTLTNTVIVTPRLRTDFFITVPNLYLNSQVNTNSYQQFALNATLNNGTGPYRYSWSFQMEEGDIAMGADPGNTNGIVRARGTNRVCSGFLTCTVTDANGASHSDSGYIRIQFGSGVPV
jgi:hypothetical protein